MNEYPYPVLQEEESAYKDSIFLLKYSDNSLNEENGKCLSFEFEINLKCDSISKLITDNKCQFAVKYEASKVSGMKKVTGYAEKINVSIPLEKLVENDQIKFTGYILVNVDGFKLEYQSEMKEEWSGFELEIPRYYPLAISNTEVLDYDKKGDDLIQLNPSEELNGKGFEVDLSNHELIQVNVGTKFNEAYGIIKQKEEYNLLFITNLTFEVFVYVLIELVQNEEEYNEDCNWYDVFIKMFNNKNPDDYKFDDFKKKAKYDGFLDMSLIYEQAHLLSDYQLEHSIISLADKERSDNN